MVGWFWGHTSNVRIYPWIYAQGSLLVVLKGWCVVSGIHPRVSYMQCKLLTHCIISPYSQPIYIYKCANINYTVINQKSGAEEMT